MKMENCRVLALRIIEHLRDNPDQHTYDAIGSVASILQKASHVFRSVNEQPSDPHLKNVTDQDLKISVAKACGLEVIVAESHQWDQPEGAIVFWPAFPNEGRLIHKVEGEQYTSFWNPIDDLKLAYKCAAKVWTLKGCEWEVICHAPGEYACYACNGEPCISGGIWDTPARAICHTIHAWRTRETS